MTFRLFGTKEDNNYSGCKEDSIPASGTDDGNTVDSDDKPVPAGGTAVEEEHYDGVSFKELHPEIPRPDEWDHSRGFVRNLGARRFLQRVRETMRRIELLERRMKFRQDAGMSVDDVFAELVDTQNALASIIAETAEEIGRIGNVGQEMVLVKRYIDTMSWDAIAESMDIRVNTVLKFHGRGLHHMQEVLLEDGLIGKETEEDGTE